MKKNLKIAAIIYTVSAIALVVYLVIILMTSNEVTLDLLPIPVLTFVFFAVAFLIYLIYFLKQKKILENEVYIQYLGMGIRVTLGFLVSSIISIFLIMTLMYSYWEKQIENWWDIVIPVVVFVTVNMVCFIALKPRP